MKYPNKKLQLIKMFSFQLLIITTLVVGSIATNEERIRKVGYFQNFLIDGLASLGKTYHNDEMKIAEENAIKCVADLKISSTFCDTFINYFTKCVNPMLIIIEQSNDTRSRDAPRALIMSLTAVAKYVCDTDGEHILEIFNPCAIESVRSERKCIEKRMADVKEKSIANVVPWFCTLTTEARFCVHPKIETQCPNVITKEAVTKTVDAILKPCKAIL